MTTTLDHPTYRPATPEQRGVRPTVVVGISRSRLSGGAIELAARIAAGSGARVVAVAVDEGPRGWACWGLHASAGVAAQLYADSRVQTAARLIEAVLDSGLEPCQPVQIVAGGQVIESLATIVRRYCATDVVIGPSKRSRHRYLPRGVALRYSRVESLRRRCPGVAVTVAAPPAITVVPLHDPHELGNR